MKVLRAVTYLGVILGLATFVPGASTSLQDKPQSVVGIVVAVDPSRSQLTVRTDAGDTVSVQADSNTTLVRIPAGQRTLANGVAIQFGDIASGDRVLGSGTRGAEN